MSNKDLYDGSMVSETGNWNVADKFSKVKIMLPMAKCEFYEDLAQFGYESFLDELVNWNSIPMDVIRIKGLTRLVKELLRLCQNTKFAMKKGDTKTVLEGLEKSLEEIKKIIPALYKIHFNNVKKTKILVLNNERFDEVLDRVIDIKAKINDPLNKNDLIFVSGEEFDPKAFKKSIMERMASKG